MSRTFLISVVCSSIIAAGCEEERDNRNTHPVKMIEVTPDTLYFTALEGGGNPNPDSFDVSDTGAATIAFSLSESSIWFVLDKDGGTTPEDVEVSVDVTLLTAGNYFDSITVTSEQADNSPQFAYISLTVEGNGHETGGRITLDHVDGLFGPDSVQTGVQITFYVRLNNNSGATILGLTHGFRIYSPDGANWDTSSGFNAGGITPDMFDQLFDSISFSTNGSGADTVGFGGFNISGAGIPDGFNDVAFGIQIGPINDAYHGQRICLDSTFYPPGGEWLWSTTDGSRRPTWDGPYCFRIVNP